MLLKNATLALAFTAVLASGSITRANAADIAPMPDTSEWRFTVAPYVWGVGLTGDVGLFGLKPVEVDIPFSDIIQNLDFAAMGIMEAHNGTWGVVVDLNYTNLSADTSVTGSLAKSPINYTVDAELEVTEFIGTVLGEWRAYESGQITFDLLAGARYWNVQNDISVDASVSSDKDLGLALSRQFSGDDGASWVDPMVGFKTRIDTDSPVYFTGWGMVGGFGVGAEIDWDAMGGIGYKWNDTFSSVLAYRAIGVNYDNDGFVYDVVQHGVALGLVFNF